MASASATLITVPANSAGATRDKANAIASASKGLDSYSAFTLTGSALQSLQDQIYTLQKTIAKLNAAAAAGIAGATVYVLSPFELSIPAATTTTVSPTILPGVGQMLPVFLTNDATGGGQITWGAGIKGVTANDIDPLPLSINAYLFTGRIDGNAWCISKLLGLQP